jgi:hypothetical protein
MPVLDSVLRHALVAALVQGPLLIWPVIAMAQSAGEPARGRLLYEIHCIACHNSQVHWRDQRLARDWPGLVAQVRGWQARANLAWGESDVLEVARHLNDTIYRFERPLAALGPGRGAGAR